MSHTENNVKIGECRDVQVTINAPLLIGSLNSLEIISFMTATGSLNSQEVIRILKQGRHDFSGKRYVVDIVWILCDV